MFGQIKTEKKKKKPEIRAHSYILVEWSDRVAFNFNPHESAF